MNPALRILLLSVSSVGMSWCWAPNAARAQAGLRESLELLDRNQNGYVDPSEITALSRPYLERITAAGRLSLDRPNRIDKLQEAARGYYAMQNGVAEVPVDASRDRALKSFRRYGDDPVVPEFGLAEVKYPYQQQDLDEADETLARYDRNRDGLMSRSEASRGRWTHMDPFSMDLNQDDQLSRLELAQRYARRRLLSDDVGELIQRARRVGNGIESSERENSESQRQRERTEWWASGGDRYWLTAAILGRFDANRNGRLEFEETVNLGVPVGAIDADQDGELSRDELFAYLSTLQDQTGDQVAGLPGWFYELDLNRDKQIELTEFATELSDARIAEFLALDVNQDGLLAPAEVLASKSMMGGTFENSEAEMLPPRKTIVSEIEITENFGIADLNLQLTLTHTNVSHLDAYLTGPNGARVELFSEIGGREDHFEQTVFDDQAELPIVKARPPFEGSFQPHALTKRQPGLAVFNGTSIQGIWQLTIRCSRSDRFGMLHHWSLIARPDEETLLNRPELAASLPNPSPESDSSDSTVRSDADVTQSSERSNVSPAVLGLPAITTNSDASAAGFWTPERKAEFTEKLRRPDADAWLKMNDQEKRDALNRRAEAIKEYKRALGKPVDEEKVKDEKIKDREHSELKELKKERRDEERGRDPDA